MQTLPPSATEGAELHSLIAGFLERIHVMTIATSNGDRPWTATVYFAPDADLHLYFVSNRQSRHAQELRRNPWMAAALYDPSSPSGKARGLQIEGRAAAVEALEFPRALSTYSRRFPWAHELASDPIQFLGAAAKARLFRVAPDRMWYLDEESFGPHGRREWSRPAP